MRRCALGGSSASRSCDRLAHDNPHWPVSDPESARQALELHRDCDFLSCATLVAAVIVSRENYRYFRRAYTNAVEARRHRSAPTLGSGA